MDPFLWQLLLMWAGRHAAWHCCGQQGPRARSRWRGEGKEEGVVVRTFMWDTSKHILVMCYSNPGNSVQMHSITSWQSGVCKTVTAAAAVTELDFSNFSEHFSPCSLIQIQCLYLSFLLWEASAHSFSCKWKLNVLQMNYAGPLISWEGAIVMAFLDLPGYGIKGAVQTWKWQIRWFCICREIARERFFHVSRYSFLWTNRTLIYLMQQLWC